MLQHKNPVACTQVYMYTVCLHLEQAFETLLEEMNLDTDVLEKHSLYNLNCSSFKHTVACANTCITMPCCVTAVGLCKIISGACIFCFLSWETRSSTWFSIACSQFSICAEIENHESSRVSRLATDCQLTLKGTVSLNLSQCMALSHGQIKMAVINKLPTKT